MKSATKIVSRRSNPSSRSRGFEDPVPLPGRTPLDSKPSQVEALTRAALLFAFFGLLFFSFTKVSWIQPLFHVGFSDRWLALSAVPVCLTIAIGAAFVFARFSFGYLVGFYLFVMMAGYFWLNAFSLLSYDHHQALVASAISIVLFLLPALMVRGDIIRPQLSAAVLNRAPEIILAISTFVLIWCALDNFHIVGFDEMEKYRAAIARPRLAEYAIGNINGALIPFALACAFMRDRKWMVAALCVVSLAYYPITFTKTAILIAPFVVFVAAMSVRFEARIVVILSLMIPLLIGLVAIAGSEKQDMNVFRQIVFGILDFRLLAVPAISLEHYFAFFQHHPHTYFCQVSFLRPLMSCPYSDQLGVLMANEYHIGSMNASLFATEGVASVGALWMPLAALVCGLIIGVGNKVASGLPARFVLISGAIVPHTLLNVPLSTTFLSNGLALLMLLWWITPRDQATRENVMVSMGPPV
ncbi:hypothetical protein [Bradyrhizobium sp. LTSPM299]|uniref:hypothetical protein n=1 Tax=Bradyrhizobium sp. LTSPM299 TaxID=1619233 RepID=UPI000B26A68B|nr:hypothetical protein [Bradyrhizobium sp. LTSPM299]